MTVASRSAQLHLKVYIMLQYISSMQKKYVNSYVILLNKTVLPAKHELSNMIVLKAKYVSLKMSHESIQ